MSQPTKCATTTHDMNIYRKITMDTSKKRFVENQRFNALWEDKFLYIASKIIYAVQCSLHVDLWWVWWLPVFLFFFPVGNRPRMAVWVLVSNPWPGLACVMWCVTAWCIWNYIAVTDQCPCWPLFFAKSGYDGHSEHHKWTKDQSNKLALSEYSSSLLHCMVDKVNFYS